MARNSGTRKMRILAVIVSISARRKPPTASLASSAGSASSSAPRSLSCATPHGKKSASPAHEYAKSLSAAAHSTSARWRAEYSSTSASWIMVSSRWVAGLSTGTRAFSASDTMVNATPASARLGRMVNSRCPSVVTIVASEVELEMSEAVKSTIRKAGSARKPTSISRRAPSVPNAVPMSMAASEMNRRASAKRPTSAIASAAGANGRLVDNVGTIMEASSMQPNTTYGAIRNIGEALCATTDSFQKSL